MQCETTRKHPKGAKTMIKSYAFWLPALAMAASTMTTPLHISPDAHLVDNGWQEEWDTLFPYASLQPEHAAQQNIRKNMPAGHTPEDTTGVSDIWDRLRTGFNLPQQDAQSVQAHIDTFHNHPRHIEAILKRGKPYLFYILNQVEERGMPAELALLPVIESAFDPFANSPAGAAGIWQFMPVTAKHVGLRRDWWVDDRRDIIAATDAALDYLSELHQRFNGDWLLALSAYNAGSARVKRAIRRNHSEGKAVDFWSLPLPDETRGYVPKLMALRAIISRPEAYGIKLPALPNSHYFTVVDAGGQIDLQVAAQLTGTPMDELQRLNPGLIRSMTPPDSTHTLLIPSASVQRFHERLAQLPADQRVQSVKYRVREGDTLSAIALNSQTTVSRLRQINQLEDTRIIAGKLLIVPTGERDEDASAAMQSS
jgi:membrane-bound lytic murein transglycosylase D